MSPKVLIVAPKLDVGGAERHLLRVVPELRAQGIDASVFLLERGGELESALMKAGVTVAGPAFGRKNAIAAFFSLIHHFRVQQPDIAHFFLPAAYLLGSVAAMLSGVRTRIMSRRSLAVYQEAHPVLAQIERWLHRHMAALIGNSRAVADQLVTECGTPAKVGIIPTGIEAEASPHETPSATRKSLGISSEAFVIIVVANLIAYKGHHDLLAALAEIKDRLPRPWRLILAGRDDGIAGDLAACAERAGLRDNYQWLGERPDVDALLGASDLAVVSSHQEGFSNSLIEAMRAGLPVVATAVGGNLDAVIEGETGLLVPVHAPAALGDAILALASDPARRLAMGTAGRVHVASEFSLASCVERYIRLYRGAEQIGTVDVQSIIDHESSKA